MSGSINRVLLQSKDERVRQHRESGARIRFVKSRKKLPYHDFLIFIHRQSQEPEIPVVVRGDLHRVSFRESQAQWDNRIEGDASERDTRPRTCRGDLLDRTMTTAPANQIWDLPSARVGVGDPLIKVRVSRQNNIRVLTAFVKSLLQNISQRKQFSGRRWAPWRRTQVRVASFRKIRGAGIRG